MELERVHFEIFQRFEKSDKATKKKTKQESEVCLDPVATPMVWRAREKNSK